MNRVVRACLEFCDANPIVSIHDQGAGGNGNVLKEICEPLGAVLDARKIPSGDPTLSLLELWGAEYQENNALLLRPEDEERFTKICNRERSVFGVLGAVTGDGRVILTCVFVFLSVGFRCQMRISLFHLCWFLTRLFFFFVLGFSLPPLVVSVLRLLLVIFSDGPLKEGVQPPVDLPLELVLGKLPRKTFKDSREVVPRVPLSFPAGTTAGAALRRVLTSLSVSSKRWLTNKVDRSVTGLIARQQVSVSFCPYRYIYTYMHVPLQRIRISQM